MKLNAADACSETDLIAKWGSAGEFVSPRPNRTTEEREAYLARRLFLHLSGTGKLAYPVTIAHSDAPDFCVTEPAKEWLLEVTEATAPEDQREMSMVTSDPTPLGAFGGRGQDGYVGDVPEDEVIGDINKAIAKKSTKPYAGGRCSLLIYVNSNPVMVAHRETVMRRLVDELVSHPFAEIYLYWDSETIDVVPNPGVSQ